MGVSVNKRCLLPPCSGYLMKAHGKSDSKIHKVRITKLGFMKPICVQLIPLRFEPHKPSAVSVGTKIQTEWSTVCLLAGVRDFSPFPKRPHWLLGPSHLLLNGYFPGYKAGCGWSCAEVKNEWSYTSVPPTCLYFFSHTQHSHILSTNVKPFNTILLHNQQLLRNPEYITQRI
jgi:hypothetical protein